MKRILIVSTLLLALSGCGKFDPIEKSDSNESLASSKNSMESERKVEGQEPSNQYNPNNKYYGTYQMDPKDSFDKIIKGNPIDRDYNKEFEMFQNSKAFSIGGWIELEDKYGKIWTDELNATIINLKSKLSDEEFKILEESQKGWLQYHSNEAKFVDETFIYKQHFGAQGYVMSRTAAVTRIRERTIELLEYLFELNNYIYN